MKILIDSDYLKALKEETVDELSDDIDNKEYIYNQLKSICDKMGEIYVERDKSNKGRGDITLNRDITISVRYSETIDSIKVKFSDTFYDCTDTTDTIENISQSLQTASMIIHNIQELL